MSWLIDLEQEKPPKPSPDPKPKPKKAKPRTPPPNALLQKGEMGGTLRLAVGFARKYANSKKSRWFRPPLDEEGFSLAHKGEADMESYRDLCRNLQRFYNYTLYPSRTEE